MFDKNYTGKEKFCTSWQLNMVGHLNKSIISCRDMIDSGLIYVVYQHIMQIICRAIK